MLRRSIRLVILAIPLAATHSVAQPPVVRTADPIARGMKLSDFPRTVKVSDNVYTYDNLTGLDPNDPYLVPIGLATGSQSNLLFSSAEMLKAVGGEHKRVIPVHEDRLKTVFPSRATAAGLHVVELALADGRRLIADVIVAADGSSSCVRDSLGLIAMLRGKFPMQRQHLGLTQ